MKKLFSILVIMSLLFGGCAKEPAPEIPNTMPPSVMIDGQLYQTTGKQMPGEVDPSVIEEISETVPPSQLPCEDGQSNWGDATVKYAFVNDGLVVLLGNEWTLFELVAQQ